MFSLELFTIGEPTNELLQWLKDMLFVKDVYFESNPNKEHDSIWVDIVVDDVEQLEEITDYIENEFYSRHEVIDFYETYCNSLMWE